MEEINYRGFIIKIEQDVCLSNPRKEFDTLGTMVCFHGKYNLGDEHNMDEEEAGDFARRKDIVILPLFLYDHSGLTMNTTGFHCLWDSGPVGFIYADYETIRKEYRQKRVTKKLVARIINYLKSEVETYDNFLTGDVYGYNIESPEGEHIDSCWGFYGYDHEKSGLLEYAKNAIDCEIESRRKVKQERTKIMVRNRVPLERR